MKSVAPGGMVQLLLGLAGKISGTSESLRFLDQNCVDLNTAPRARCHGRPRIRARFSGVLAPSQEAVARGSLLEGRLPASGPGGSEGGPRQH